MKNMPVLFVGHGSPMNAIENNKYTEKWIEIGKTIEKPKAILSVSAHWFTKGTRIINSFDPKTIHDMYGFPRELYEIKYNAKGSPHFADEVKNILGDSAEIDNSWGIDHGTWSVLCRIFPKADVPVFQLSVNQDISLKEHFTIGQKLKTLREQGVMIFASGNVVHNLSMINWNMDRGYDWAEEFDEYIKQSVINRDFESIFNYQNAGEAALKSFYMLDHFAPLMYVLGASDENDKLSVFNNSSVLGALSMTSYLFE